jgi:hypothetical protein
VTGLREFRNGFFTGTDYDQPPTLLGNAVMGCEQDSSGNGISEILDFFLNLFKNVTVGE